LRYTGYCDAMKGLLLMGLIDANAHPSLHPKGPEITWRGLLCSLVGHQDGILLSNLKNLILEKVGGLESRVLAIEQLGLLNEEQVYKCGSPLETMTYYLSKKLAFTPNERDIVIMRHDIGIEWSTGEKEIRNIDLVVYGDPAGYSAMAKCVGYPCGIASKMVLAGEIQAKGMVVPMSPEIYHPMLKRLHDEGISAVERSSKL